MRKENVLWCSALFLMMLFVLPFVMSQSDCIDINGKCLRMGFCKYPPDCSKFYQCAWVGEKPFLMDCGISTLWNNVLKICGPDCVG